MLLKLQNMYFFCFWREQQRGPLINTHLSGNPLIDITQLFFVLEGQGAYFGSPLVQQ